MKCARASLTGTPFAFVLLAASMFSQRAATAGVCKPDGKQCQTNVSCCGLQCKKPTVRRGKAVFGSCCTPTTCAAQRKNCGAIPNGTCGGTLDCGTCTAPQTCGGGGTPNVCGCTPTPCAAQGTNCGTIPDGCGATLDCGPCPTPTAPTPACLALRAPCQSEEECCQDGATTCDSVCCHFAKEACAAAADCCGSADCRDGFCCVRAGGSCNTTGDCCLTGFEGECDNGTCVTFCRGKDAQCDNPAQCCEGDECIGGRCRPPGCLPAGYRCSAVDQCCEEEQTFCGDVDGTQPVCCHPNGGSCAETRDCCGNTDCCSGLCCGPDQNCCLTAGTCCQSDATCCGTGCCPPDRDCCNGTCCPYGQFCSNGSCACLGVRSPCDPTNNQCCQSEPTSCLDPTAGQWADRCCRPKGGTCSDNLDCCRNIFINANVGYCSAGVCGGDGAACSFHEDCVGGFCYGHCNNVAPLRDCFSDNDCPSGGLCIEKECTNCPAFTRPCGNECCFLGHCCGDHCC